jgi:hypothetical protein
MGLNRDWVSWGWDLAPCKTLAQIQSEAVWEVCPRHCGRCPNLVTGILIIAPKFVVHNVI